MVLLFFSCIHSLKNDDCDNVRKITVDNSLMEDCIDFSVYLSDSFDVIPLETTDDCLLSEIKKVQIESERYIYLIRLIRVSLYSI